MNIEDLKSGMAFETESGDFYVVFDIHLQEDVERIIVSNRGRSPVDNFLYKNAHPDYKVNKVFNPVRKNKGVVWELIWEYQKPFTKSDLKSGMRVIRRDGKDGVVFLSEDGDFISATAGETSWLWLSDYKDNLTLPSLPSLDIMKVYEVHPYVATRPFENLAHDDIKLLWERKE